MVILWIILSVFILLIVIETLLSYWLNYGVPKEEHKRKAYLRKLQEKLLRKNVS